MPEIQTTEVITLSGGDLPGPGQTSRLAVGPYRIEIAREAEAAPSPAEPKAPAVTANGQTITPEQAMALARSIMEASGGGVLFTAPDAGLITAPGPVADFCPVVLDVGRTAYVHAARLTHYESGKSVVAKQALCSGRQNGRPVRARDTKHTLADVNCPRCVKKMGAQK